MKFLVLQHIPIEHPGIFKDFMIADNIIWDTVELDQGELIPTLGGYDAMIVMGGPMDVFDEDQYPWLKVEKSVIQDAVLSRNMPFLGICLGHQLLAEVAGGHVNRMMQSELGIKSIALTDHGQIDPLFLGLDSEINCLQWHSCEVSKLPPNSKNLANSPQCRIQALKVGSHAYGLQYHVELTSKTVQEWGEVPIYKNSLEEALGPDGLENLKAEAEENMPNFKSNAYRIYTNFLNIVRAA